MKLVILAAGKGKRMGESSSHTPKPLLKYQEKSLIEHKIEKLPEEINEIILIIGHLGEKIRNTFGDSYTVKVKANIANGNNIDTNNHEFTEKVVPISYVEQKELLGTAHALHQAKHLLTDSPFLILMGDDLYAPEDLQNMINHYAKTGEWSVLLEKSEKNIPYGKCIVDEHDYLRELRDDPAAEIPSNNMYTGACLLTPEFFDLPMTKYIHSSEFGLPYTFILAAKERNIKSFYTKSWKRITAPEDLVE